MIASAERVRAIYMPRQTLLGVSMIVSGNWIIMHLGKINEDARHRIDNAALPLKVTLLLAAISRLLFSLTSLGQNYDNNTALQPGIPGRPNGDRLWRRLLIQWRRRHGNHKQRAHPSLFL